MKKKVLFVATVDSHIELFHLPYLKMFKDRGYEVHVATDSDKKIKYCNKKIKLPIKRSPFRFSNLKAIFALKKILKTEKYDIIHCHTPMGGVVARLAARKARRNGTRVIYTAHGFHFYEGAPILNWLLFYPVEKWLSRYTDTLITINAEDFERSKAKFGKRCLDIQYIPGVGVDEKKFEKRLSDKQKKELRKSLGLKGDNKVLICVGRLDKNKNQGFLIKVMRELLWNDGRYHLLLVGSDENKGKYQKIAKRFGISDHIHFLGFRDDVVKLLQISDVAVSASKREGLPVNLVEAAFLGIPIVATDCRGNRDVCEFVGGKLSGQGDVLDFAKYVERGSNSKRECNLSNYSVAYISENMERVYFRKKRVLHLLITSEYGGAENVACTIIKNLSDKYDFFYASPDGEIGRILAKKKVDYAPLQKISIKNIRKIIKTYGIDIVHAHDYKAGFIAAHSGQRCILHIHHDFQNVFRRIVCSIYVSLLGQKFMDIIVVSEVIKNKIIVPKRKKEKFIFMRNPVAVVATKRKIVSLENKDYDLCCVARVSSEKNPKLFLKIVASLSDTIPGIKAIWVGNGNLMDECKDYAKEIGLDDSAVKFIGFRDNPIRYINKSKVFLLTSDYEGYPMSIIEAMSKGLPCVTSDIESLGKIVNNNYNGYLCSTETEYVDKIKHILTDKKEYNRLAEGSFETSVKLDNHIEYMSQMSCVYNLGAQ